MLQKFIVTSLFLVFLDARIIYNKYLQAEKRAHHNALERKRRDHIKDSFSSLRDSVPALHGEKVASRAQILKKAAEYIQFMRKKNTVHQQDIDDLKRQNALLDSQSKYLFIIRSCKQQKGCIILFLKIFRIHFDQCMQESERLRGY